MENSGCENCDNKEACEKINIILEEAQKNNTPIVIIHRKKDSKELKEENKAFYNYYIALSEDRLKAAKISLDSSIKYLERAQMYKD